MKEIIDDDEYDDQYLPVDILKSEGFRNDIPTTFYTITLEADFDEEFEDVLENNKLDVSGYTLETIILEYLEKKNKSLLEHIISFDTEATTFVAYADTEENQHQIAALIQELCTNKKIFKKITKDNLEKIRNRYS